MSSNQEDCIFCNKTNCKVISSTKNFFIIRDTAYPVTKHHTLIITNRHVADFFDLTKEEMTELDEILKTQKVQLKNCCIADCLDMYKLKSQFGRRSGKKKNMSSKLFASQVVFFIKKIKNYWLAGSQRH